MISFPPESCATDVLCTTPLPPPNAVTNVAGSKYAYNDGDGTTRYDVEAPIQLMGFDPNFHFIGMTFNPEPFVDMKDKYYLHERSRLSRHHQHRADRHRSTRMAPRGFRSRCPP